MPDAPLVRPATPGDAGAIVAITRELIADGGVFPHTADQTDAELRAFWYAPLGHLFVAEVEGTVADRWSMDAGDGSLRVAVGPSSMRRSS